MTLWEVVVKEQHLPDDIGYVYTTYVLAAKTFEEAVTKAGVRMKAAVKRHQNKMGGFPPLKLKITSIAAKACER